MVALDKGYVLEGADGKAKEECDETDDGGPVTYGSFELEP